MSYSGILLDEVMSWQVPNAQIKIILLILADHTDSYGVCYPSIERMTKLSCMSRSSVIRSINWLVENEIIIRHSGGKGKPSLYQFSVVKETEMKKNSVTQTHKGNKVIDISEYIYPSSVRETLPFDDFWNLYPRKVGKGHARLAFKKACEKEDPIKILLAVKEFAEAIKDREKQFIPHPTTWLNGERWDDEIEDVAPKEGTNTDRLKNILQWQPEAIEDKK